MNISSEIGKNGAQNTPPVSQTLTETLTTLTKPKSTKETTRSNRLKGFLKRGITIGRWGAERPKPFWIRYPSAGKPKLESFAFEQDRNDLAEKVNQAQEAHGSESYDPVQAQEYAQFKAETGATIQEIRELWTRSCLNLKASLTVRQAYEKYAPLKLKEKGKASFAHPKITLTRFCDCYGHLPLTTVTPSHIRDWLADLEKTGKFVPLTLRHYLKHLCTFYNRAIREEWALKNPTEAVVPPPDTTADDIGVLSLQDTFSFFKANIGSPIIGKLALEAFAGLRCSSAVRLAADELDHTEGGVTYEKSKHKLNKRYYVDGFPPNLWEWLKDAPEKGWTIKKSNYDRLKSYAFVRANVPHPHNVLRHSFCTNHIAAFKDAAKTAVLLTHSNPTMLYRHYKGRGVSEKQGLAYFQITPESVKLTYEQFLASQPILKP